MIKLKIVCKDEKYMPAYATELDACMDLKVRIEQGTYQLQPNEKYTFGTGIQVAIPEGKVMIIYLRSSSGIKKNLRLANSTGIIDSGYRDEIRMALVNTGNNPITLEDGDRICQFMIIEAEKINLIPTEDDEDFRKNDRGGGIGSTGR